MFTKSTTVVALLSAAIQARNIREVARSLTVHDPLDYYRGAEPDSNVLTAGFSGECGGHNVFVGVTDNEEWDEDLITAWIDIDCEDASDSGIPLKFVVGKDEVDTGKFLKCQNWTTETYEGGIAFDEARKVMIDCIDSKVRSQFRLNELQIEVLDGVYQIGLTKAGDEMKDGESVAITHIDEPWWFDLDYVETCVAQELSQEGVKKAVNLVKDEISEFQDRLRSELQDINHEINLEINSLVDTLIKEIRDMDEELNDYEMVASQFVQDGVFEDLVRKQGHFEHSIANVHKRGRKAMNLIRHKILKKRDYWYERRSESLKGNHDPLCTEWDDLNDFSTLDDDIEDKRKALRQISDDMGYSVGIGLCLEACIVNKDPHESLQDQIEEARMRLVDDFNDAEIWDGFYNKVTHVQGLIKNLLKDFSRKNRQIWKKQNGGQFIPSQQCSDTWYGGNGIGALRRDHDCTISLDLNGDQCELTRFEGTDSDGFDPVDQLRKQYDCARYPGGVSSEIDLSPYYEKLFFDVVQGADVDKEYCMNQ